MTEQTRVSWWHSLNRGLAAQKPVAWLAARTLHHVDPLVYRLSGGRYTAANLLLGLPVILLTTVGARSGQEHTVPLLAIPYGQEIVLIASNWGRNRNPGWYYNLKAHPRIALNVYGDSQQYLAREATMDERDALWEEAVNLYGGYETYRQRTGGRRIPVMVLTPQISVSAQDASV